MPTVRNIYDNFPLTLPNSACGGAGETSLKINAQFGLMAKLRRYTSVISYHQECSLGEDKVEVNTSSGKLRAKQKQEWMPRVTLRW